LASKIYKLCDKTGYKYDMTVYSLLHGGEESSSIHPFQRYTIPATMAQVGRHE